MTRKIKRHTPERIVEELRDAEAMLNVGKVLTTVIRRSK